MKLPASPKQSRQPFTGIIVRPCASSSPLTVNKWVYMPNKQFKDISVVVKVYISISVTSNSESKLNNYSRYNPSSHNFAHYNLEVYQRMHCLSSRSKLCLLYPKVKGITDNLPYPQRYYSDNRSRDFRSLCTEHHSRMHFPSSQFHVCRR